MWTLTSTTSKSVIFSIASLTCACTFSETSTIFIPYSIVTYTSTIVSLSPIFTLTPLLKFFVFKMSVTWDLKFEPTFTMPSTLSAATDATVAITSSEILTLPSASLPLTRYFLLIL